MVDWNDALASADTAVAGVFDTQTAVIRPKKKGFGVNAEAADDSDRAPFTRAVSIEREPQGFPVAQRPAGDPAVMRNQVFYEAVMTAVVADWPWLPVVGDMVLEGTNVFAIASVQNDGTGRVAFYLNRAG